MAIFSTLDRVFNEADKWRGCCCSHCVNSRTRGASHRSWKCDIESENWNHHRKCQHVPNEFDMMLFWSKLIHFSQKDWRLDLPFLKEKKTAKICWPKKATFWSRMRFDLLEEHQSGMNCENWAAQTRTNLLQSGWLCLQILPTCQRLGRSCWCACKADWCDQCCCLSCKWFIYMKRCCCSPEALNINLLIFRNIRQLLVVCLRTWHMYTALSFSSYSISNWRRAAAAPSIRGLAENRRETAQWGVCLFFMNEILTRFVNAWWCNHLWVTALMLTDVEGLSGCPHSCWREWCCRDALSILNEAMSSDRST